MAIKSNIPALMKAQNVTASDLMRKAGVAYSTAHYLSKGRLGKSVSLQLLSALCELFGVGVGDILIHEPDKDIE